MKNIVRKVLLTLSLVAMAQSTTAAGDAVAGAAKAATCGACHGADGNSLVATFPKLAGLGDKYLLKQLEDIQAWDLEKDPAKKEVVGREVPEMTGLLVNMTQQDLADLAAHFGSQSMQLSGAKNIEVQVNSGIKVDGLELGQRIYRAGNPVTGVPACTGCHSPDGKGNNPAAFPRLSGQHPEYVAEQLRAFRAGDRTNDGDQAIMRAVADKMSDAEITAVANYIGGLH